MSDVQVLFLQDGGQSIETVADALTEFIAGSKSTLDIALYDAGLVDGPGDRVSSALNEATDRGVEVRFAYYQGEHRSPVIVPPVGAAANFASRLKAPTKGITGFQTLMHQKYAIRDAQSEAALVWTGSCNWTNDSWTREENVILQVPSKTLAALYSVDFQELWSVGSVDDSGGGASGSADVQFQGSAAPLKVWFSPNAGEQMAHEVADVIRGARERIIIASPVLTDGPILGAVRDAVNGGTMTVSGVYDATQMNEVNQQWQSVPNNHWKIDAFAAIVQAAHMSGKHSTPYGPGTVHDYMHLKAIVVDDGVFTGSYNFSRSGETNAENMLFIQNAALAQAFASFIGQLVTRYAG